MFSKFISKVLINNKKIFEKINNKLTLCID